MSFVLPLPAFAGARPLKRTLLALALSSLAIGVQADELPAPVKALQDQGITIEGHFAAEGGLTGYAAQVRGRAIAIYVTPDQKHAVVGTLLDENANDLSEAPLDKYVNGPANAALWKLVEKSHWVREGRQDAPRVVYIFSDPNCPYCRKFWQEAQPWITAGKVQLRHLMVGVITPDSAGQAAALLSTKNPGEAIAEHYRDGTQPTMHTKESEQWVTDNTRLMMEHRLNFTPVILYQENGITYRVDGAPADVRLSDIMGGEAPKS